jgi:hypothetical protein
MDKKLRFKQQTPGFHQQNITGMTWMAIPLAIGHPSWANGTS